MVGAREVRREIAQTETGFQIGHHCYCSLARLVVSYADEITDHLIDTSAARGTYSALTQDEQ